jgi:uncharacterized membrane protein HdeD (DUF308 family)
MSKQVVSLIVALVVSTVCLVGSYLAGKYEPQNNEMAVAEAAVVFTLTLAFIVSWAVHIAYMIDKRREERKATTTALAEKAEDEEMTRLLRRVAEALTPPVDPAKAEEFAKQCVDSVRRIKRRQMLVQCGILAALIGLLALASWFLL